VEAAGDGVEFAFCMCNPPFFDPEECDEKFNEVRSSNKQHGGGPEAVVMNRKARRQLAGKTGGARSATVARLREICTQGGEVGFIRWIVQESLLYMHRIK
jgi:23S rRNA A1618 N6-methylase RlmF